jgi:hypothetical protein
MNTIKFNKKALDILNNHFKSYKTNIYDYGIDTIFGELLISFDPSPKINVYSIFMMFSTGEKFNHLLFSEWFGNDYNKYSLKWNIISSDAEFVLNEFEERLENLNYLRTLIGYLLMLN